MNRHLEADYDTLTLQQWRRRQAEEPPRPRPLPTPSLTATPSSAKAMPGLEAPTEAPARACESCGAYIAPDADPRRRYCSASCRAIAAKRRNAMQPPSTGDCARAGASVTLTAGAPTGRSGAKVAPPDLDTISRIACGVLGQSGVGEVEIRMPQVSFIIRR